MAQQRILEGTPAELAPYLAQHPNQRFRLIELSPVDGEPASVPKRDPDLVARVRSIRGKYARTDGVAGTEELHQERQRDKAREEARIRGYRP